MISEMDKIVDLKISPFHVPFLRDLGINLGIGIKSDNEVVFV